MPLFFALIARALIQMAVTLGIVSLAEKYVLPLLNKGVAELVKLFGVSEEEAKDIAANEVIQFIEQVGIGAATIRLKLPTKVAEFLGFTSKGWARRKLSPKAQAAVGRMTSVPASAVAAAPVPTAAEATQVIAAAKVGMRGFTKALAFGLAGLNTIFIGFIAVNNLIDFGNWNSGAYQKTFQKIFEKVTFGLLKPDEDYRQTKTVSPEVFDKVYNTYKLEGAAGINDPFKQQSVFFTRDNLIDLLDRFGAELLRTTQRASTKDVIKVSQLAIVFPESIVSAPPSAPPAARAVISPVKVFTGVVAQGTLGAAQPFLAREDDLVSSVEELREAAQNNLIPFIQSLGGRLIYEVKIVSSVLNKDGTRRVGGTQQVVRGYKADGTPLMKTITNKFAVMDIFIFTARNVRSKVETITLGPVDSVKLQPSSGELNLLAADLRENVVTSDISEITAIETSSAVTISPAALPPVGTPVAPPQTPAAPVSGPQATPEMVPPAPPPTLQVPAPQTPPAPPAAAPAGPAVPPSNNPNRCAAVSIAEFFDVSRVAYPTVAARGILYEAYGLGPAAWYTGTSEQNVKLLAEFKRRSGCS